MELTNKKDSSQVIINNTKNQILESLLSKLQEIKTEEEEVYFHDIVSEAVDINTPIGRKQALNLIDFTGEDGNIDEGLIDNSSIDRTLITTAYCCLEQTIFNDDFFQELQEDLNNERITENRAKRIIIKIKEYQKRNGFKSVDYEDTHTQIFLRTLFNISVDDFKEHIKNGSLIEKQLIELGDGVKILTSNKSINQNAVVIEKVGNRGEEHILRVYFMEKDKGLDIRNFFKLNAISEETGFNLSPSAYIEQTTEEYEQDKIFGKKNYLTSFSKEDFIRQIVTICQRLTIISIEQKQKEKANTQKIKVVNVENDAHH